MKKFYLMMFTLFFCMMPMSAQKNTDLQFVTIDEDGKETGVVTDGAVIKVTEVTDNGLDPFISAGLGVKNASNSDAFVQIEYFVERIDNGSITCCYSTCANYNKVGRYYSPLLSKRGNFVNLRNIKSGAVQDLAAEWTFAEDGQCSVTFSIKAGTKNTEMKDPEGEVYDVSDGPSVTVNFVKGDAASIRSAELGKVVQTSFYDLIGRKLTKPLGGVCVKKQVFSDGTTKVQKVVVR